MIDSQQPEVTEDESLFPQDSFVGRANQVNIDFVTISNTRGLKEINIGPSVIEIEINQGLTTPFIHGKITISDMHNMRNVLPIIGDELLKIQFTVPGSSSILKTFYTREVSIEYETGPKNQLVYFLYFTSKIFKNNINQKICIPFRNTSKSMMVKRLYDDYLKDESSIKITPTDGVCNLIVPYLNPLEAIELITKFSSYKGHYDYSFYEDFEKCNFVSLSTLKKASEKFYFTTSDNPDYRGEVPNGTLSLELMRKKILDYTLTGTKNDISTNIILGTYGSTHLNFDMTNKKINKFFYSYVENYPEEDHINEAPPIPLSLNEELSAAKTANITLSNEPSFTYGNGEKPLNIGNSHNKRKSINNIFFQTISLEINGTSSILPGDIVYLDIRKHDVGLPMNPDMIDPVISGRYMVINVVHYLRKDGTFHTSMIVGRDSLPRPLPSTTDFQRPNI